MLKNYFKTAFRNLLKNKTYSILNISGLAIGFASCLLIIFYLRHELSYDKFHENHDRIFRVGHVVTLGTGVKEIASTTYRLAPTLKTDFQQLEKITHFGWPYSEQVEYEGKIIREARIAFADSMFFQVFSFEFLKGDPNTALSAPMQVVVTESIAQKYFGNSEPMGQTLKIVAPFSDDQMELRVSGVIKDMPENSHFHMNLLISMPTGNTYYPDGIFEYWGWDSHFTYVAAPEGYTLEQFNADLLDFGKKHIQGDWFVKFFAQKADGIHLYSNLNAEIEANGDINSVYIFSIVAIIILLIACVNYMNLATAKATNRSKEVGIRKTIGARRQQIIFQFFSESILIILVALILSFFLAQMTLPLFNQVAGKNIPFDFFNNASWFIGFFLLALLVGMIAASYPAIFLSSFRPVKILKNSGTGSKSILLRKGLVIFQFTLSIVLISGTVVVFDQLSYLRSKKIGADVEQVVIVPAQTSNILSHYETIKSELLKNSHIKAVTSSARRIGRDINRGTIFSVQNNNDVVSKGRISNFEVSWDFFDFYDLELVSGRFFSKKFSSDTTINAVVLNETAVNVLGLNPEDAIGKTLKTNSDQFTPTVVGVVKDFHMEALYNKIKPMAFFVDANGLWWNSIKISSENIPVTLAYIEQIWKRFEPHRIFQYDFLDVTLFELYRTEEKFLTVFTIFTSLAIFTACLGIFGLASFAATQRIKEIGIRKVVGASVSNIVVLLSRELTILVGLSFLMAIPISYFVMNRWLEDFVYRINIGFHVYILAGILALLIAWLTVSYQSVKAALANPVDSLRYE